MGLSDRLSKIKSPDDGASPQSPDAVYRALLALNRPDVPFVVRDGRPEGADLAAEWKILDPEWRTYFGGMHTAMKTLMRLDVKNSEVRSVDLEYSVTWAGPNLTLGSKFIRGQISRVQYTWQPIYDSHGNIARKEKRKFSSKDIKTPLQDTVTGAGWLWRGIRFGNL